LLTSSITGNPHQGDSSWAPLLLTARLLPAAVFLVPARTGTTPDSSERIAKNDQYDCSHARPIGQDVLPHRRAGRPNQDEEE
jgi:hypothetical protein